MLPARYNVITFILTSCSFLLDFHSLEDETTANISPSADSNFALNKKLRFQVIYKNLYFTLMKKNRSINFI